MNFNDEDDCILLYTCVLFVIKTEEASYCLIEKFLLYFAYRGKGYKFGIFIVILYRCK